MIKLAASLSLLLLAHVVAPACAADDAPRVGPGPGPRYVYAVWTCTASGATGDWRCDGPPGAPQLYGSLDDCRAGREAAGLRARPQGDGVIWYMCYKRPTWQPAEPAPLDGVVR